VFRRDGDETAKPLTRLQEVAMRLIASVFGMVLLASVAAGADKEPPKPPPEKSEVDYDSKTHGALQVRGDTKDWFLITRDGKDAGPATPPLLKSTVELAPGTYDVSVNKTKRTVKVQAGKKTILETGTLDVEGKGADWYAPYEGKDRRTADAPPKLNTPIALFPGKYTVHVHYRDEKSADKDAILDDAARVEAGQKTVLKFK
jgi:hypothetical protein